MQLYERLKAETPKRILSLDGGGARIILSLGFLEEVERVLRDRLERPDLRLCDYFDLIGGTSAGALVASALATGMGMSEAIDYSLDLAERIFHRKKWKPWEAIYDEAPLRSILQERFGDMQLSDAAICTGLCIVTKRADTRSTWPFHNHPDGRFYAANKDIHIRDIVHASAAAPIYFEPVGVAVGGAEEGAFFDGGVSMANNPSLQLFALATLSGYPFGWATGAERLLLTSIGTGNWGHDANVREVLSGKAWDWAWEVPMMLIDDANMHNQMMLQWMSQSPTSRQIDAEIGDLSGDQLGPEPMLHYLRYDVSLEQDELERLGFSMPEKRIEKIRGLTCASLKDELLGIGRAAARIQIRTAHFPEVFDKGIQARQVQRE